MMRRMPGRGQQPHVVANHGVIRHQVGPPRLQHGPHGFLENLYARLRILRLPEPHLVRREHIPRLRKRRRPFAVHQPRIPPHMIRMQVRAEHVINILVPQPRGLQRQLVLPPLPLMPVTHMRQGLVVPNTGIDQNIMVRRAHHVALKGHDRPVVRVQRIRRQPAPVLRQHLLAQLRQHLPQAERRAGDLHNAVNGQIASGKCQRSGHGGTSNSKLEAESASRQSAQDSFLFLKPTQLTRAYPSEGIWTLLKRAGRGLPSFRLRHDLSEISILSQRHFLSDRCAS